MPSISRQTLVEAVLTVVVIAIFITTIAIARTNPQTVDRPMMVGNGEVLSIKSNDPSTLLPTTDSIGTSPVAPAREGIMFLIADTDRFRYNFVGLSIGDGGEVNIWRYRDGKFDKIGLITLPKPKHGIGLVIEGVKTRVELHGPSGDGSPAQPVIVELFKKGDHLIIERAPGLFVVGPNSQFDHPDKITTPFLSMIDNWSNDSVGLLGVRRPFVVP